MCRMESARSKAELAGQAAAKAFADADRAKLVAKDAEVKERRDAVRGNTSIYFLSYVCGLYLKVK